MLKSKDKSKRHQRCLWLRVQDKMLKLKNVSNTLNEVLNTALHERNTVFNGVISFLNSSEAVNRQNGILNRSRNFQENTSARW